MDHESIPPSSLRVRTYLLVYESLPPLAHESVTPLVLTTLRYYHYYPTRILHYYVPSYPRIPIHPLLAHPKPTLTCASTVGRDSNRVLSLIADIPTVQHIHRYITMHRALTSPTTRTTIHQPHQQRVYQHIHLQSNVYINRVLVSTAHHQRNNTYIVYSIMHTALTSPTTRTTTCNTVHNT